MTKLGSMVQQSYKGTQKEVLDQVRFNGLDLISIQPDYQKCWAAMFVNGRLSGAVLSSFFKDFSRGLKSGLSAHEAIVYLDDQSSDPLLKETLRKLNVSIIDGHSFKEAFMNTKVFGDIVINAIGAGENSGNLAEVGLILSDYYKFMNDHKILVIKSLIYPACVFVALSAASIVISVKLVPQLTAILPDQGPDLSRKLVIGYADFIRSHGWMALGVLMGVVLGVLRLWSCRKERLMRYVVHVPLAGHLIKDLEFSFLFLNLYVYQKSGVPVIAALTNLCGTKSRYITGRLAQVKDRVYRGLSLGEAVKADPFFPPLISMNISKGEATGNLAQYFHELYQYYDQRSRESIETCVKLINPVLLGIAVSYLGLIISCFILPLYSSMNGTGYVLNK